MLLALHNEIAMQSAWLAGAAVDTVYIGGGTPSLLSRDELMRLFDALFETFTIAALKECTLEANPDDLDALYLRELRSTPVSRLSIGVQSFRDEDLLYMRRAHSAYQSENALKAAQDAGFSNLSIDLIYGTPGLGDAGWLDNIHKMASMEIPHFSAYALTVEEGTALHHSITKKAVAPVDAAQSATQMEMLMEAAPSLGYEQYEISNFAKPGCYAIHNTAYWEGVPYLGLGPSAHSFNGRNTRQWNVANNARYIHSILQEAKIPFESEVLTSVQRLNEYIMTSLRTMWGCDLGKVEREWGSAGQLFKNAAAFIADDRLKMLDDHLMLTGRGKLFADNIAASVFLD